MWVASNQVLLRSQVGSKVQTAHPGFRCQPAPTAMEQHRTAWLSLGAAECGASVQLPVRPHSTRCVVAWPGSGPPTASAIATATATFDCILTPKASAHTRARATVRIRLVG